ncbi:MAG: hypothetical protein Kow0031_02750 [Anaerolineae bacterium]
MTQPDTAELLDLWSAVKTQLRQQMTRATFDQHITPSQLVSANGVYRVEAANEQSLDWLEHRLRPIVTRTLANQLAVTPETLQVEFCLPRMPAAIPPVEREAPATADPIAAEVAQADLLASYLDTGGSGYAQLPHLYTHFWLPLLGPAFDLWLSLTADDKRSLKAIAPNCWTPARSYTFRELAARLNQQNPRCVYGYADECHHSRQRRLASQPLTETADCCRNRKWAHIRRQSLPEGGYLCQHWVEGRLEALERLGLARVHLAQPTSRKPRVQIWRLLPPLTPAQAGRLTPHRRRDFEQWLTDYGHTLGLTPERWQRMTAPSLLPLMPGYDRHDLPVSNLATRQARQDFAAAASANPNYLTCLSDMEAKNST